MSNFAEAARSAAKPAALGAFRAAGMSAQLVPPLLFQLARAALAATEGVEQESVRKQLQALAAFSPEELQLRLRETLGLATHRLDAWATGLASEALFALREKRPDGLQIGAYGWVENLRRDEQMRQSEGHCSRRRWRMQPRRPCCVPAGRPSAQDPSPSPGSRST